MPKESKKVSEGRTYLDGIPWPIPDEILNGFSSKQGDCEKTCVLVLDPSASADKHPYTGKDIKKLLDDYNLLPDVLGCTALKYNFLWDVTFTNAEAKEELVSKGAMKIRKGLECYAWDPTIRRCKLQILWLPVTTHLESIQSALSRFGKIVNMERKLAEDWIQTKIEVTIELAKGVTTDSIPHVTNIGQFEALIVIKNRRVIGAKKLGS